MQKKQIGSRLKQYLKVNKQTKYFLLYVLGLLVYGFGSSVLLNQAFIAHVFRISNLVNLTGFGMLCVMIGFCLLCFIFNQFYKRVGDKRRILKALLYYVLFVVISGVVLGVFGKVLYEVLNRDYDRTKRCIWIVSTLVQGEFRFVAIYYCLMIYKSNAFDWRSKVFVNRLVGVCMLLGVSILVSIGYPMFGIVAMFITDMIIATASIYVECFQTKKES